MTTLNIGAGRDVRADAVNVDRKAYDGVDIVHDLNVLPWPFEDESADEIVAFDILEHLIDLSATMDECYRILAPGGRLLIRGPMVGKVHQFADPTHFRAFTTDSFDFWCPATERGQTRAYYCGAGWRKASAHEVGNNVEIVLEKLL